MIFNMGGTGQKKPKTLGKYAWRKYVIGQKYQQKTTSIKAKYVAHADTSFVKLKVYASTSMKSDSVNGIYTLTDPEQWELNLDGYGLMTSPNQYIMFGKSSGSVVFKTGSYTTTKASVAYNIIDGGVIIPDNANAPLTKYSFEIVTEYTFEEFVVSDEAGEYPEDGDLDEFHYEQIT